MNLNDQSINVIDGFYCRFFSDETCKFLVETEIRAQKEIKREEECRIDKEMERKLLMRKKRESLMEKQRQKGAKLMEIHRENEGLSQDDVNAMDITTVTPFIEFNTTKF